MKQEFPKSDRKKTAVKELILWVGGITISSLIIVGAGFYYFSTAYKIRSLEQQAIVAADEIAHVLAVPLYNLDDDAAVHDARVFLASGRLYGIKLISSSSGLLIDSFLTDESLVPKIHRQLSYRNIDLGSMTILISDSEVRSAQKTTLLIISLVIGWIILVYAVSLHFVFSRILIAPLRQIISGIKRFGRNDFSSKIQKVPYDDLNQLVSGLNIMASDINDNQQILIENQKKYSSIFNSSFVAILLCNEYGKIIEANDTAVEMFQAKDINTLIGCENIGTILLSDNQEETFENFWKSLIQQNNPNFGCRGKRLNDGSEIHIEIVIKPMIFQESEFQIVNILDITARKDAEEKFLQAQKMEAIGVLAGGLAHDFNNLLMAIQGRTSLIAENSKTSESNLKHIALINEHIDSASNLTQQLLGTARGGKYDPKPININSLVKKSLTMFGRTRKDIEIVMQLSHSPIISEVDERQFEHVLLNMYVNAGQAMAGGGKLYMRSAVKTFEDNLRYGQELALNGPYAEISITDTGVGMNESTQRQIFDPFFTTKEKGRGTGLGLSSAYGIVRNHGGLITVFSEVGCGTTFTILLPISEKEPVSDIEEKQVITKGEGTILLIDDETIILDVTQALLETLGYRVKSADGGEKAIEMLKENELEVDLVLLDLIMPGMDGGATFDSIRKIDPQIPIILSSGYAIDGEARRIMQRGCNAFIQKPYTLGELSKAIQQILNPIEVSH